MCRSASARNASPSINPRRCGRSPAGIQPAATHSWRGDPRSERHERANGLRDPDDRRAGSRSAAARGGFRREGLDVLDGLAASRDAYGAPIAPDASSGPRSSGAGSPTESRAAPHPDGHAGTFATGAPEPRRSLVGGGGTGSHCRHRLRKHSAVAANLATGAAVVDAAQHSDCLVSPADGPDSSTRPELAAGSRSCCSED